MYPAVSYCVTELKLRGSYQLCCVAKGYGTGVPNHDEQSTRIMSLQVYSIQNLQERSNRFAKEGFGDRHTEF